MIPLRLSLSNFLSYRQATLDFGGLHVACVCGANGAGKSSLLEAIAWAVWGQSRVSSEDNVIHLGETEARVDFTFRCQGEIYRIIRTRYRRQSSALEFQIQTSEGFRVLTGRGLRATQQLIHQHIRLDYDTFINSSYLRQGRADEFMLKRPSERKRILADLLKLDQYDQLAERSREKTRQLRAELSALEHALTRLEQSLLEGEAIAAQYQQVQQSCNLLQQTFSNAAQHIQTLRQMAQERAASQQAYQLQCQTQQRLEEDCRRLEAERQRLEHQQQEHQALIASAAAIKAAYAQYQALQEEDAAQSSRMEAHQTALRERQEQQQQQQDIVQTLSERLQRTQIQIETLVQQEEELAPIFAKSASIADAKEQLTQARVKLVHLDQMQLDADPLLQQRRHIQMQLDQQRIRLITRLDELQQSLTQTEQQAQQADLQEAIRHAQQQIQHLQRRRAYQEQVRERGLERRRFMDRLQERQRDIEQQLALLDQKMGFLNPASQLGRPRTEQTSRLQGDAGALLDMPSDIAAVAAAIPCPLCDRPLDDHHRQRILTQYQGEQGDLQDQLWTTREQLAAAEREIQIMRQEYRQVEQELAAYDAVIEHNGQLKARVHSAVQAEAHLSSLQQEHQTIQQQIQTQTYATDLIDELQALDQRLQHISYDERSHALARGEVDRWRWADIKQAELHQAQKQQQRLKNQQQTLSVQADELTAAIEAAGVSELQQNIDQLDRAIATLAYDVDQHTAVRQQLTQAQSWVLRYQALQQAQVQLPDLQARYQALTDAFRDRIAALKEVQAQVEQLRQHLQTAPADLETLDALEQEQHQRRQQLDQQLAQLGRLQEQQQQQVQQQVRYDEAVAQQHALQYHVWVYDELTQAFGRNGIQALMIETALPQLEADANRILGRLSANQLHLQFVTQRASKTKTRGQAKLIDTLDILIADTQGTRPYETYSGGEAFRVNFAIRLAIARLLAQRSGTPLQLLIIDEGFGTQDAAGCDRLIAAINAIAADFSCVLAVTHVSYLREAFQARIEVSKTGDGSQLQLVM
ncbi:MAG: SMC family ATPase [Elainellaceae cyanobacterium]